VQNLRGEKAVEAILKTRATAAQILEVVYDFVPHRKVVVGGEKFLPPFIYLITAERS
jgi:hypothetical protein